MNILYIAYSCSPYNGTEDQIGWNIPIEMSEYCDRVFVITKPEGKGYIEEELEKRGNKNIEYIYVDIPDIYKKIFKGRIYSGRLNIWNRVALEKAKQICCDNRIELIHQVNPVEFRSIGNYGEIDGVKFVCGPVGGGEYMSSEVRKYAKDGMLAELIRRIANTYYKIKYKMTGRFKKVDKLLFANDETRRLISNDKLSEKNIYTEIGSVNNKKLKRNVNDKIVFLSAGRIIYRKGFMLLLDAVAQIPEQYEFTINIAGDGEQIDKLRHRVENNPILRRRVKLLGKVEYGRMKQLYASSSAFVMPSLRETTGTVILEALENGLPVIAYNGFGAKEILNNQVGYLYDYVSDEPYIALEKAIINCIRDIENGTDKSEICMARAQEYLYKKKARFYFDLYSRIIRGGE